MIKKIIAFMLSVLLLSSSSLAEMDEEDLSFLEIEEEVEQMDTPGLFEEDGSSIITVTCTGDFTIGGDNYHRKNIFSPVLKEHNDDINFTMANVRDILMEDDLTLINFEGTFTDTKHVPSSKKSNQFLFNISPKYVNVLTENGIEAVSIENNHIMDHGEEGYNDTVRTLEDAGVQYSSSTHFGLYTVKGVTIAMLSYLCIDRYYKQQVKSGVTYDNLFDMVAADIQYAKKYYPIVIVSFHWGFEKDYYPKSDQIKMGRLAVDSGADLVIGNHSHRFNPIEQYKGVYICYSLGNFCFAGNSKPSDMTSYLFQTRFKVSKAGDISNTGFRIIPIRITSKKETNNFVPTPITDDQTIDSMLLTLKANGEKYLEYAVPEYPLSWE